MDRWGRGAFFERFRGFEFSRFDGESRPTHLPLTQTIGPLGGYSSCRPVSAASFDWIVGRHVVSHLYDPLAAFQNWATWLCPNGRVLVVEGFWPREDWEDLADRLPLSCLQTRATIGYLLEQAGFMIEANDWLAKVNAYWGARQACPPERYLIVARRVS